MAYCRKFLEILKKALQESLISTILIIVVNFWQDNNNCKSLVEKISRTLVEKIFLAEH